MQTKIYIKDLKADCILGVSDIERRKKQGVIINISLTVDAMRAIQSDNIQDALDYRTIYEDIISLVKNSQFHLLESLANAIVEYCMKDTKVLTATVSIEKPTVLEKAGGVRLEMTREKS